MVQVRSDLGGSVASLILRSDIWEAAAFDHPSPPALFLRRGPADGAAAATRTASGLFMVISFWLREKDFLSSFCFLVGNRRNKYSHACISRRALSPHLD